jgi:hypothetical protein
MGTCMDATDEMGFKHRPNQDGSVDSICLRCFHTVGTAYNEQAFPLMESTHKCREKDIRRYVTRGDIHTDERSRSTR